MYYELLLGILVLMFLSGVFSASETAMMSLSRAELKRMSGGEPSEKMVCRLLKNPQRLLSTILVGNMFVNVLLASLFATFLERCFSPTDGMGFFERLALAILPNGSAVFAAKFGQVARLLLNVVVVTPLLMIFGEQTPKVIAFANSVAISKKTSAFFSFLCIIFTPINWILHFLANVILRLCGQEKLEKELPEFVRTVRIEVTSVPVETKKKDDTKKQDTKKRPMMKGSNSDIRRLNGPQRR